MGKFMRNPGLICFCILLSCIIPLCAQFRQVVLYPGDSAFALIQKLVDAYKPLVVLDYSTARTKMYTQIYNQDDSVACVYSGHHLYLDPQSPDPIGYLSKNGNDNGINCEHSFPQSKGADWGNARSDMHHLFPTRAEVNEARSNFPFAEIIDSKTETWYYRSFGINRKPSENIDDYSESIQGYFEPREDHKGNVARAIFYFFTMYELQADRNFFESMRQTLCQWHLADPVDSLEWARSHVISTYQENKANPFVLDCSLARRCFCPAIPDCMGIVKNDDATKLSAYSFPNPSRSIPQFNWPSSCFPADVSILNSTGLALGQYRCHSNEELSNATKNAINAPGLFHLSAQCEGKNKPFSMQIVILP
ncbi:MAG: endonuclease [Saprospiraceae bacterium]|nr:endonuclease [Saprospiraceae bacterium]